MSLNQLYCTLTLILFIVLVGIAMSPKVEATSIEATRENHYSA